MGLLNRILGEKKLIADDFFGKIESQRIRKEKEDKEYSWNTIYFLPNAPEETGIILEGSYRSPNKRQLNEIKLILSNYDDLFEKIYTEVYNLRLKQKLFKNWDIEKWKNNYFLSAVFPLDGQKPHFELCFDPMNIESLPYISFNMVNNDILNFKV